MHSIFICVVFPSWTLSMCVFKQCFWLLYDFYIIFCSYIFSHWDQNLFQKYPIYTASFLHEQSEIKLSAKLFILTLSILLFAREFVDFCCEMFCKIVYKAQIELSCPWVVYIYSWGVVNTCIFLSCWVSAEFSSYQSLFNQILRICSSFYESESGAL